MMKKYIIGLGCSWTQGEGGYPEDIWERHNGRIQLPIGSDYHLRKYELKNSWVNVLCRDFFPDHIPVNLGVRGVGNRGAVNQLYFCDSVDFVNSTGVIILMSTGLARQDIFSPTADTNHYELDFYSNGDFKHYKWENTSSIFVRDKKFQWNDTVLACEFVLNLLHLQIFCEKYKFKLVFANAFQPLDFKSYINLNVKSLSNKINWDNYFHKSTPYTSFLQYLITLDKLIPEKDYFNGNHINFYRNQKFPTKYLTNCNGAHPTIEGYKEIANELASFIKQNI